MIFKPERKYVGSILISSAFADLYIEKLDKVAIKTYLKILEFSVDEKQLSLDEAAVNSGVETDEFLLALSVLQKEKLIKLKGETITVLNISRETEIRDDKEFYTPEEIDKVDNNDFSLLRNATEKAFSKILSHKDVNKLVELFNWVNIPAEVAVLIIEYVASQDKKSLSYVEKVAIDWAEKGIDTVEKAHEFLGILENVNALSEKIKRHCCAYDKVLSKKDREYIASWQELYTEEEIFEALEITVNSTERLKFSYTDKVLKNKKEGNEKPDFNNKEKPKSKFNNFKQDNTDFDDFEKRAMEKLLAKHNGNKEG